VGPNWGKKLVWWGHKATKKAGRHRITTSGQTKLLQEDKRRGTAPLAGKTKSPETNGGIKELVKTRTNPVNWQTSGENK